MENSVRKISKALLDLASVSDAVLYATPKAQNAIGSGKLDGTQKNLLDRIDGFRSIDQLLAMSGDLFAVHAALAKLMAAGLVTTDFKVTAGTEDSMENPPLPSVIAAPVPAAAPVAKVTARAPVQPPAAKITSAPLVTSTAPKIAPPPSAPSKLTLPREDDDEPVSELDNAKLLLLREAKFALGKGAEKLRTRIEACKSIEEIFDLIVKVQEHLASSGKADPDAFLDRLTTGLAAARKKSTLAN